MRVFQTIPLKWIQDIRLLFLLFKYEELSYSVSTYILNYSVKNQNKSGWLKMIELSNILYIHIIICLVYEIRLKKSIIKCLV